MKVNVMSFRRVTAYLAVVVALAVSAAAQTAPLPAASSGGLDEAKSLVDSGKYTEAIAVLEGIASSDQASAPQALQMMAGCYKILQTWSKAIKCFEKLLADHPNSVAPDREVTSWIMDCCLANNEPDKALALRKELLSQYQSDAWRLYYIVGRRRFWSHEYSRAVPELEQAVRLCVASKNDPEIIDANKRLLQCYILEKQWSRAERIAQKLAKDYPDQAYQWHCEMGKCYQGQGEYDKAIACLELAAELSPSHFEDSKRMFKALLDCYDETGRLDKAIPLAEKLVGDYPEESAWQWRLGWYYLIREQYAKAAPLFERVIKLSKEQWEIRKSQIYLGQCLFNLGKGDEALDRIETYFKNRPELWDDHLLVKAGVLFYGPKDDEGCVAAVKELLAQVADGKKSSLVPTARELMYRALKRMGKQVEAASVLEAMGADSKDPIWLSRAGQDYYKAGKYTEAKRVYKAVTERAGVPDGVRADCMYGLALCYWDTGLRNAARRLMQKVSEEYPKTEGGMKARGSLYFWSRGN